MLETIWTQTPQLAEVSPTDDALTVARMRRKTQLAQARERGLI